AKFGLIAVEFEDGRVRLEPLHDARVGGIGHATGKGASAEGFDPLGKGRTATLRVARRCERGDPAGEDSQRRSPGDGTGVNCGLSACGIEWAHSVSSRERFSVSRPIVQRFGSDLRQLVTITVKPVRMNPVASQPPARPAPGDPLAWCGCARRYLS